MHLLQWRRKSKNIMLINRPRKQKERQIELNKSCNPRFRRIWRCQWVSRFFGCRGLEVQENLRVPKVSEVLVVGDLALN